MSNISTGSGQNHNTPWKAQQIAKSRISSSTQGPAVLLQRPMVAARIAAVVAAWSHVEWLIVNSFAHLIDAEGWVAAELMQDVRKFDALMGIFTKHYQRVFGADEARSLRDKLNRTVLKDLASERDQLAHGLFMITPDFPADVVRIVGWGKDERFYLHTAEQLDALIEQISTIATHLGGIFLTVVRTMPPKREPGRAVAIEHPLALEMICEYLAHNNLLGELVSQLRAMQDESRTTDQPNPPQP